MILGSTRLNCYHENDSSLFTTLPAFLGGIMDAWLDAQDVEYRAHLRTHLAYIYEHVRKVPDPTFVDSLRQSHHEAFHELYLQEISATSTKHR